MAAFVNRPFVWSRVIYEEIASIGALYTAPKGYLYQGSWPDGTWQPVQNNTLKYAGLMCHPLMSSNVVPTSSNGGCFRLTEPSRRSSGVSSPYSQSLNGYSIDASQLCYVNFTSANSTEAGTVRGWSGAYARDGSCSVALTFYDSATPRIHASIYQKSPAANLVSWFTIADTIAYAYQVKSPIPRAIAISTTKCWVFYTSNVSPNTLYARKWNGTTFEAAIVISAADVLDYRVVRGNPAGIYVGVLSPGTTLNVHLMDEDTGAMSAVLASATGVGNDTQDWVRHEDIGGNDTFLYKGYSYVVFRFCGHLYVFRFPTGNQATLALLSAKTGTLNWSGHAGIEYDPVSDTAFLCDIVVSQMPAAPAAIADGTWYDIRRPYVYRSYCPLDSTGTDLTVEVMYEMESYTVYTEPGPYYEYDAIGYIPILYIPSRDGAGTKSLIGFRRQIQRGGSTIYLEEIYHRFRSWNDDTLLEEDINFSPSVSVSIGAVVSRRENVLYAPEIAYPDTFRRKRTAFWEVNWVYSETLDEEAEVLIFPEVLYTFEPSSGAIEEATFWWYIDPDVYIEPEVSKSLKLEYHWLSTGRTWYDEFHDLLNEERALFALPPVKKMGSDAKSLACYRIFDIAQIHTENMIAARVFEHESSAYPPGWQTVEQRIQACAAERGAENILAFYGYFATGPSYTALPTPLQAFTAWKNSPYHYANMIRDWGSEANDVYSSIGVGWGDVTLDLEPQAYEMGGVYLTNNFIVLVESELEAYFENRWSVDALDGVFFSLLWNESYFTRARADVEMAYGIGVAQDLLVESAQLVAQDLEVNFGYAVAAEASFPYSLLGSVAASEVVVDWDLLGVPVVQELDIPYGMSIAVDVEGLYGDLVPVGASVDLPYSSLVPAFTTLDVQPLLSSSIVSDLDTPYDILVGTPVVADVVSYYDVEGVTVSEVEMGVRILYNGIWVPLDDAVLTANRDSPGFTLEANITDPMAMEVFTIGMDVQVDFVGTIYSLKVSGVSRELSPEKVAPTVKLKSISPIFFKGSPYSENITFAPTEARLMSLLIQDILGQPVGWYVVDWVVPYGRAQSYGKSALETAQNMLASIGAMLVSLPDGSVEARYVYGVSLDKVDTGTPDVSVIQEGGVFSMLISVEYDKGYNRFHIMDSEGGYGDKIEWDEETEIASVSIYPYRTTWTLACTTPSVQIEALGEIAEEVEEEITFTSGEGTSQKPIVALLDIQWISTPLGSIAFDPYSTKLTAPTTVSYGYGLAKVKYQSKRFQFKITAVDLDSSQLIVLEN